MNPRFMLIFMAFPLIWVAGMPVALIQDRVDVATSVTALVLFDAPVAALVLNFFWHYRLELTQDRLAIHRYFRWGGRTLRFDDISRVTLGSGLFGAPRIVFESPRGDIKLMWRGKHGNWWPPPILDRMLVRLEERGVQVTPEVRAYLTSATAGGSELTRGATIAVFGLIAFMTLAFIVAGTAAATNDLWFALGLTAISAPILAVLYAGVALVFWLNERHYGDLRGA